MLIKIVLPNLRSKFGEYSTYHIDQQDISMDTVPKTSETTVSIPSLVEFPYIVRRVRQIMLI